MKFKSLSELTRELNALISAEEIQLTLDQLENANQLARDISERLIVLRHKAYEKWVRPEITDVVDSENQVHGDSTAIDQAIDNAEAESEISTPFFQMSLIDAIEEASAAVEENQSVEPQATSVLEDPGQIQSSLHEEVVIEEEDSNIAVVDDVVSDKSEDSIHSINVPVSQPVSQPITLADKHQFEKIDDLKRAITLNQRFQFSKELFKGNNQEYEVAIDRLNNSTREEALLMLRDLRAKFDWQEESSAALDFYGLVERRYSAL